MACPPAFVLVQEERANMRAKSFYPGVHTILHIAKKKERERERKTKSDRKRKRERERERSESESR